VSPLRVVFLPILLVLLRPPANTAEALDPWQALTLYRFPEARRAFTAAGPEREQRFGLALAWINLQPKTDDNLARADALLQGIVAESSATDELAHAARFYCGRIQQVHLRKPDTTAAQKLFRALMDEHPGSFWGQLAGIKWLTLEMYTTGTAATLPARLEQLEHLASFFTLPQLAKDYHNIMANAYEALAISDQRAFNHLAECWRLGVTRGVDQADFLARLGTLAERLGRHEDARRYFGEFLERFVRDERRYMIEQRMAHLRRLTSQP
jgi:tetratricopeptide (TPR) repeat protein